MKSKRKTPKSLTKSSLGKLVSNGHRWVIYKNNRIMISPSRIKSAMTKKWKSTASWRVRSDHHPNQLSCCSSISPRSTWLATALKICNSTLFPHQSYRIKLRRFMKWMSRCCKRRSSPPLIITLKYRLNSPTTSCRSLLTMNQSSNSSRLTSKFKSKWN